MHSTCSLAMLDAGTVGKAILSCAAIEGIAYVWVACAGTKLHPFSRQDLTLFSISAAILSSYPVHILSSKKIVGIPCFKFVTTKYEYEPFPPGGLSML